jgi:hypothetical protein
MAQEFAIKKMEVAGDKINIYYDLIDTTNNRTYTINLYSTMDSFTTPLTKVSGDLGLEVKPGMNRKITFNAKEELGEYEGKIGFEIKGRVYVPFIKFNGFKDQEVRKRGVKFDMLWSGGRANSLLNFELYKDGKFIAAPHTNVAASVGKIEVMIPKNVKPGRDYQFRITDSRNKDDMVFTDKFRIKRKFPLALKVGVLALVGGAAYFLTSGDDAPPTGPEDIIDPLTPKKP